MRERHAPLTDSFKLPSSLVMGRGGEIIMEHGDCVGQKGILEPQDYWILLQLICNCWRIIFWGFWFLVLVQYLILSSQKWVKYRVLFSWAQLVSVLIWNCCNKHTIVNWAFHSWFTDRTLLHMKVQNQFDSIFLFDVIIKWNIKAVVCLGTFVSCLNK